MIKKLLALITYVPIVFVGFALYGLFEASMVAIEEGSKIIKGEDIVC